MAWTVPKTFAGGSALTAAELNTYLRDNTAWLKDALTTHGITSDSAVQPIKVAGYGCSLTIGSQNISSDVDTALLFDTEEWDDAAFHHPSIATWRITIPSAGRYLFNAWVRFDSNATGHRSTYFELNGVTEYNRIRIPAASGATTGISNIVELDLEANDYVGLRVRQNSGSTLAVAARYQVRRVAV